MDEKSEVREASVAREEQEEEEEEEKRTHTRLFKILNRDTVIEDFVETIRLQ